MGGLDCDSVHSSYNDWFCDPADPGSVAVFDIDPVLSPVIPAGVSADGMYEDRIQITWALSSVAVFYYIFTCQNS
ncbi:MAG: hypothetical protein HF978_01820 [Desulfobacteraceae bacterium]|nr:hypothetical protein [Desulfobacteraceae bacterium]MBC2754261.1 hypothetical protein [Desulfobacteraceae bacterium]